VYGGNTHDRIPTATGGSMGSFRITLRGLFFFLRSAIVFFGQPW
jgi:hypothetical protein